MTKTDNLSMAETRLDDALIREYLQENTDFFDRHPDLLSALSLRHQQAGSVSLVERQQRVLREQIASLQEEITELMTNAQRNEKIFSAYSALYANVLRSQRLDEVLDNLHQVFIRDLGLQQLSLKIFAAPEHLHSDLRLSADTHQQLLSKRFAEGPVYLGRLPQAEQQLLFKGAEVESVALVLLEREQKIGILALGSQDPSHFDPNMDYLLISQLQALLSVLLPDLIASQKA